MQADIFVWVNAQKKARFVRSFAFFTGEGSRKYVVKGEEKKKLA